MEFGNEMLNGFCNCVRVIKWLVFHHQFVSNCLFNHSFGSLKYCVLIFDYVLLNRQVHFLLHVMTRIENCYSIYCLNNDAVSLLIFNQSWFTTINGHFRVLSSIDKEQRNLLQLRNGIMNTHSISNHKASLDMILNRWFSCLLEVNGF